MPAAPTTTGEEIGPLVVSVPDESAMVKTQSQNSKLDQFEIMTHGGSK